MSFKANSAPRPSTLTLEPVIDVVEAAAGWRACSKEPWLRLKSIEAFTPSRVFEIRYSTGLTDEVVRPILRFINHRDESSDWLMAAAAEGAGFWRGRVPPDIREVWISPTNRVGVFSFQIDDVRLLSRTTRLKRLLISPKRSFFAASARIVGLRAEAELNLRWVFGRAETQDFEVWRARRSSSIRTGFPDHESTFDVVVVGADSPQSLARTYVSLCAQAYPSWRLIVVNPSAADYAWRRAQNDARISARASLDELEATSHSLVGFFQRGDVLVPHALTCFASHIARYPKHQMVYADEICVGSNQRRTPIFKPDWSPVRQAWAPYIGHAAFFRAGLLRGATLDGSPDELIDVIARATPTDKVGHLRRPVLECGGYSAAIPRRAGQIIRQRESKVGIVIPTRDRIDLLEPCLNTIVQRSHYKNFEIMVVDNGSVKPRTIDTLARMRAQDSRILITKSPGPFNFSALCNLGASKISSEFLLFLNNDTEALHAEWLSNLVELAAERNVGAVGARLLYPNRRLQHAGVVLGFGGVAGHFGDGAPGESQGWLKKNRIPHETSAVTGACLMVERRKFEAIGGFDALNLPVDLNDIDLCLRLSGEGWRSICDGRTRVLHHESASRGKGTVRPQSVYKKERDYFLEKWRHVIRDDPFFNPSLSLYDHTPKLG